MSSRPGLSRDAELQRMGESGWTLLSEQLCAQLVDPSQDLESMPRLWWEKAGEVADELVSWLNAKKFGEAVEVGILFVPSPKILDTRRSMPLEFRRKQNANLTADVFDANLDAGKNLVPTGADGAYFLTCVGKYGVSLGSYEQICSASVDEFRVADCDVREAMTRQLWGARVIQAGDMFLPDSDTNSTWTFTLFPGDKLVDGQAPSGTILKSHVRFRLGKPDRGIASARVAPAILLPPASRN